MKKLFLVAFVGLIILGGGLVSAQQRIALEEVSPVWYYGGQPILPVGQDVTFKLRITNINGQGYYYNPGFLFTLSSEDGASWDSTEIACMPSLASQFHDIYSYSDPNMLPSHPQTGSGTDTVGLVLIAFGPPALYDGFDEVAVTITIRPESSAAGTNIRLDAINDGSGPVGWEWGFWTVGMWNNAFPEWDGPHTFLISPMPCGAPEFSESANPTEIRAPYCDSLSATFEAVWTVQGECVSDISYGIIDGPGTIVPATGVWSWDAGIDESNIGQTVPLVIEACADGVCSRKTFEVTPTYGVPQFTTGCGETILVEKGNIADVQFSADVPCQDAPLEFFVADDGGAGGYYYFVNGTLRWDTYFASSGTYSWIIGATTGTDTNYCSIDVSVSTCCGTYTGGYAGNTDCDEGGMMNLVDVARLVDRIYVSKRPLCCESNGDVNGDATLSLQDVTRLIDHIYLSRNPTASCQ